MNDIENYSRFFLVEFREVNGGMEYQDKKVICVLENESFKQELEEDHLNWRWSLDSKWQEKYSTWADYYNDQINEDGAYWSDNSLVFIGDYAEISRADVETRSRIERLENRNNYDAMYNTAKAYIEQAARLLAKEKSIPMFEAEEKVLYSLTNWLGGVI